MKLFLILRTEYCCISHKDHYDWGLRAVKSVLVVAGALRRRDRSRPEDQVTVNII